MPPERIVSIRSGEIPITDFLRVVGQDKIVPRGQGLDAQLNDMRPSIGEMPNPELVTNVHLSD